MDLTDLAVSDQGARSIVSLIFNLPFPVLALHLHVPQTVLTIDASEHSPEVLIWDHNHKMKLHKVIVTSHQVSPCSEENALGLAVLSAGILEISIPQESCEGGICPDIIVGKLSFSKTLIPTFFYFSLYVFVLELFSLIWDKVYTKAMFIKSSCQPLLALCLLEKEHNNNNQPTKQKPDPTTLQRSKYYFSPVRFSSSSQFTWIFLKVILFQHRPWMLKMRLAP